MKPEKIIFEILEYTKLNTKNFSERIGLDRPQALYDIQKGKTKSISSRLLNKIISVFPEINKYWILTGEGEMLNNDCNTNNTIDINANLSIDEVNENPINSNSLLELQVVNQKIMINQQDRMEGNQKIIIKQQEQMDGNQRIIMKQQEQLDRLLAIMESQQRTIENLSVKSKKIMEKIYENSF